MSDPTPLEFIEKMNSEIEQAKVKMAKIWNRALFPRPGEPTKPLWTLLLPWLDKNRKY